ncbi:hypothetical protein AAY86_07130 [Pseudomonas amygdali pv. tabaci str. ATCC 11528]|uniref:hypothetical protein n=1 Tax=Pseudomonas amygdali TaxID=47877 RepID=UPI0001BC97F4|nr:hypothetical protein [Pseudomonas amygdali]KEZ71093.1 hypothetical protein C1E_0200625 [Pseudomonas amygdali pv. tabaci str. ATCC 11528]KKY53419.1 hypothetical protein AAY86_07130 [Pseudomonas amygdali pv. tabaci str. ATCC 11528]QED82334.1 hypothetical protein PSYTB_00710 [Pseudomonas amygdali pv. tabaci str. ATCC 11528]
MELPAQREAFCISYGVSNPQLPLSGIAHWESMLKGLAEQDGILHEEQAYVAPGFFYMPVTAQPDPPFLKQLIRQAHTADWLLVPSLKKTDHSLRQQYKTDIIVVPFMQVAYLHVDGELDACLLTAMGRKAYKEMVRLTRRTEELCHTRLYRLDELVENNQVLEAFSTLQSLNVDKYQHVRNLYALETLQALARSTEGPKYYIKMNYEKLNNVAVYGSLSYADQQQGVFSQLVQGQDRSQVPPGLNLYVSDYYQLYKVADELGFKTSCLGRSAIDIKKRMGANRVVDLDNWLIPVRTNRQKQMHAFSVRAYG